MVLEDTALLLLGLMLLKNRLDKWIIYTFLIIGFISTIILNHVGIVMFFNGSRGFFGILFAIPIIRFFLTGERAPEFKKKFDHQLKIWLVIQAICITIQFLRFGANDHGGGSMGFGFSGVVSILIYLTSFYLTIQNWDFNNIGKSFKENKWNFILLYPTLLNETKISFILAVVYAILLCRPSKALMVKLVYIIPIGIAALIGMAHLYIKATGQDFDTVFSSEYIYDYLVGDDLDYYVDIALMVQDGDFDVDESNPEDFWAVDIQRVGKLMLMWDPLKKTPGGIWFGAGLGQFRGNTNLNPTKFATQNKWLLRGSLPWPFTVIIQLGIIGMIWFLWAYFSVFFYKVKGNPQLNRILIFLAIILILDQVYNDAFAFYTFCMMITYIALALNLQPLNKKDDPSALLQEN